MTRSFRIPIDGMRDAHLELSRKIRDSKLVLPVQAAAEVSPPPIEVLLTDLEGVDGNTTLLEQVILLTLSRRHGARRVFEFGTFDGRTAANFAANLPQAEVFTIDLPTAQSGATKFRLRSADLKYVRKDVIGKKSLGSSNVVQLKGDTASFDFEPWYGTIDLAFVDACHEYDYVRSDSEVALRLLRPNSIVIWHDYGAWPGVTRALNEFYVQDQRFRGLRHILDTTLCWMKV